MSHHYHDGGSFSSGNETGLRDDRPLPPPINDGRDPGDEHHDRPIKERKRSWTVDGTDSGNGTAKEEA